MGNGAFTSSRVINVWREESNCTQFLITLFRNAESEDGVMLQSWHWPSGYDEPLEQFVFIKMPVEIALGFIKDFSGVSAQDFVDNFEY